MSPETIRPRRGGNRLAALILLVVSTAGAATGAGPAVRWTDGGLVEVSGLAPAVLEALAADPPDRDRWTALLSVTVAGAEAPMLGSYRIVGDVLRFAPRFPLEPGLRYRAVLRPDRLPGGDPAAAPIAAEVAVPARPPAEPARVAAVYPSADVLPENNLKFYLHFTAPMSRGEAYARIRLLDGRGEPIGHPFLELGEELWDPSGTRLTLLIDPGRIKQGLAPRAAFGPVLERGGRYALVVDRAWPDATGRPLAEGFRKPFRAGPADETPPDPATWRLVPPAAGTTEPLVVTIPEPLDHAMLLRVLSVLDARGRPVPGRPGVEAGETRWTFTPEDPWPAGSYALSALTELEDLAGNSIGRPFEVDAFEPIRRRVESEAVALPFRIR